MFEIDLEDSDNRNDDESNVDESASEIQINKEMIHTGPTLLSTNVQNNSNTYERK